MKTGSLSGSDGEGAAVPDTIEEGLQGVLRWLVRLLRGLDVRYQVVGGLAARAHGAVRPLHDIDLYVPDAALDTVAEATREHLVRPPTRHSDEHWDLTFLQIERNGWTIEIAGADTARVWDRRTDQWRAADIRFEKGAGLRVAGVRLQVMSLARLLDYKRGLGRDVDRIDVQQLA